MKLLVLCNTFASIKEKKEKVLFAQACLTLWVPMDCSPPSPSIYGISRQEYWGGLPFPSPGHLPNPGIKPMSPALQANSLLSESPSTEVFKVWLGHSSLCTITF